MNSNLPSLTQSKPLIPLQKEEDPEIHKTVLTNYMFPQQTRTEDCKYLSLNKTALSSSFHAWLIRQIVCQSGKNSSPYATFHADIFIR